MHQKRRAIRTIARTLIATLVSLATIVVGLPSLQNAAHAAPFPSVLSDKRNDPGFNALYAGLSPLWCVPPPGGAGLCTPTVPSPSPVPGGFGGVGLVPGPIVVGGRVITNPQIHNLYYDNNWNANNPMAPTDTQIDHATMQMLASTYFMPLAQYGGAGQGGTFTGSHGSSNLCGLQRMAATEFVALLRWVTCEVGIGRDLPIPTPIGPAWTDNTLTGVPGPGNSSVYVVYLPPSMSFGENPNCDWNGFHFFSAAVSHVGVPPFQAPVNFNFPFAVVETRCLRDSNGAVALDKVTRVASHELVESIIDPFVPLGFVNTDPFDMSTWNNPFGGTGKLAAFAVESGVGEAADICLPGSSPSGPPAFRSPGMTFDIPVVDPALGSNHVTVAPYWSNAAGACVPVQPPTLTNMLHSTSEGRLFSGTVATVQEPGNPMLIPSHFSATVDWGDGTVTGGTVSGSGAALSISGSHTYTDEGTVSVKVHVIDTTNIKSADTTMSVTVGEGDVLAASSAPALASRVSQPLSNVVVATFDNSGYIDNGAGDFSATIDWGDGSTSAGTITGPIFIIDILHGSAVGRFTVTGSHTYTHTGSFTVRTTMRDDAPGTASATATGSARIDSVPDLFTAIAGPRVINSGGTYTYTVKVTNRGTLAAHNVVINFGAGYYSTVSSVYAPGVRISRTAGRRTVGTLAGGHSATLTVRVAYKAPHHATVRLTASASMTEIDPTPTDNRKVAAITVS